MKHLCNKLRHVIIVLVLLCSVGMQQELWAESISKETAIQTVIDAYAPAEKLRVLKVENVVFNGKPAFRVKVLSDTNRVRIIYVNAKNGRILP